MYDVAVVREFDAKHYLVGGDWGDENKLHVHHYRVEVRLSGESLDRFGYLVDITNIDEAMNELVDAFGGKVLNELPEFKGLNPSIEHFCRIWCKAVLGRLDKSPLSAVRVLIWENDIAWAAYTEEL